MGTKEKPGRFDCLANALPDEPMFVLLGRDPIFFDLVTAWADRRERDIGCGDRPNDDKEWLQVAEARMIAEQGREWRRNNFGKWRVK